MTKDLNKQCLRIVLDNLYLGVNSYWIRCEISTLIYREQVPYSIGVIISEESVEVSNCLRTKVV